MFRGEAEPGGAKQKCYGQSCARLIGEGEIADDAAGEQHRQPEEPAVLLGFERAG